MSRGWEDRARQWLAWARTPGHDAYWRYREAFFAEIVPPPAGPALEVGCGEGRVARDLAERGHDVTGLDASPTLVAAAAERHPEGRYVIGSAEELPFADGSFELVVAYNTLMDVADMPRAVAEAARVLRPRGRLCACVTHPLADAGAFDGERFVLTRSYLGGWAFGMDDERDGLRMRWDGRHHSLEGYARALEDAGLVVEALREPRPAPSGDGYERWDAVPMFLMWRAVRR